MPADKNPSKRRTSTWGRQQESAVSTQWDLVKEGKRFPRSYLDDTEREPCRREAGVASLCARRRIRSQKTGDGVLFLDSH